VTEQTEDQAGVWIVADAMGNDDNIVVFPTELEALRFVNGPDNYAMNRARFLRFGESLHDLNYPRKDRTA